MWPSLFLRRDIVVDISSGWRPLTSQARGAKQPLPEPPFISPPISQGPPTDPNASTQNLPSYMTDANKTVAPTTVDDSDEQGGEDSSSSSSSDSSDSSDDECATPTTSSIMVMNEKSHVVHTVPLTNNECSKRSSCSSKDKTFEVLCGSSVLDAPIQMFAEIPQGAKICQHKACLASIDRFLKLSFCVVIFVTHRVAFPRALAQKLGFSISLARCFTPFSAGSDHVVLVHLI